MCLRLVQCTYVRICSHLPLFPSFVFSSPPPPPVPPALTSSVAKQGGRGSGKVKRELERAREPSLSSGMLCCLLLRLDCPLAPHPRSSSVFSPDRQQVTTFAPSHIHSRAVLDTREPTATGNQRKLRATASSVYFPRNFLFLSSRSPLVPSRTPSCLGNPGLRPSSNRR